MTYFRVMYNKLSIVGTVRVVQMQGVWCSVRGRVEGYEWRAFVRMQFGVALSSHLKLTRPHVSLRVWINLRWRRVAISGRTGAKRGAGQFP